MRPLGVLDRFIIRQWMGTFLLSVLGVPAVATLIDLSERFGKLTDRGISLHDIFLGQAYLFPSKMAMLFPAAVLFGTVFTLNGMGRHNELTAVKAGGVSFYRLVAPMMILAVLAVPANFAVQEWSSYTTEQQKELQGEIPSAHAEIRFNFAYVAPNGWTWIGKQLYRSPGRAIGILGHGPTPPPGGFRWTISADSASWIRPGQWQLRDGATFALGDSTTAAVFRFRSELQNALVEPPGTLMSEDKHAEEMTVGELKAYLDQLTRIGSRPGMLAVDYRLKFAIPVACLVVALFGAPLAITNPRAGAALGLAIALGTTLVYLTGVQIMKAIGGKDLVTPAMAAWSMNVIFGAVAVVLLWRVRT
jgi:lipopolysaccharide export system permease protein